MGEGVWTSTAHQLPPGSPLLVCPVNSRVTGLHNCMSQLLKINLLLYLYTHSVGSVAFLEPGW